VDVKGRHDHVEAIPRILVRADRKYFNDPEALSILVVTALPDHDLEDLAQRLIGDTEVRAWPLLSLAQGTELVTNPDVGVLGEGQERALQAATQAHLVDVAGWFTVGFEVRHTATQQALCTARGPRSRRARKQQ
jgi:hypothetical protein